MSNVIQGGWGDKPTNKGDSGGTQPPGGSGLERRIEKLEGAASDVQVRLVRIETKLDQSVTKSDLHEMTVALHKAMNEQTWKFIAAATGLAGVFSAIAFGLAKALA